MLLKNLSINKIITIFTVQKQNKKGGVKCNGKKKWLAFRILDLLAMLENNRNQPIISQIKRLLYELINS